MTVAQPTTERNQVGPTRRSFLTKMIAAGAAVVAAPALRVLDVAEDVGGYLWDYDANEWRWSKYAKPIVLKIRSGFHVTKIVTGDEKIDPFANRLEIER